MFCTPQSVRIFVVYILIRIIWNKILKNAIEIFLLIVNEQ